MQGMLRHGRAGGIMAKITKDERGLLADGKPIDESTLLELGDEELERATPRTSTTAIACNGARAALTAARTTRSTAPARSIC